MVKRLLRNTLLHLGIFYHVKYSKLLDLYRYLVIPDYMRFNRVQELFFRGIVDGARLMPSQGKKIIFDIGANIGDKAEIFRRVADQVVCVEPDTRNVDILNIRFRHRSNVTVLSRAVDSQSGIKEFFVNDVDSAYNTLSEKWRDVLQHDNRFDADIHFQEQYLVETTTLDHLIEQFGMPVFIKLDIEGYEINALRGLTQPVPYVSFEANLPEFRTETIQCLERLAELSPEVYFAFSVQEGLQGELSDRYDLDSMRSVVRTTSVRFMEILASLHAGMETNRNNRRQELANAFHGEPR